jgi:hypothetical protein
MDPIRPPADMLEIDQNCTCRYDVDPNCPVCKLAHDCGCPTCNAIGGLCRACDDQLSAIADAAEYDAVHHP